MKLQVSGVPTCTMVIDHRQMIASQTEKKRERKEKLSYSHFIFSSFEDFGHAGSEKFILHVPNFSSSSFIRGNSGGIKPSFNNTNSSNNTKTTSTASTTPITIDIT
ncbi:hypothetical protein PPL_11644 [Heterostelium album PN500]|uniref:Uncharacterized protein n=1 Tax=Heterostelium pallidum (strain ATCC 26659 / Pp 5 / PN500) TaxID=670386 RepID=D3BVB8_HETP5|nr:hypothetical protein PPL_11644 [Heterostelium album PN500]EFA74675.1 hypothetical protein PPL_11644 [Heterostelium album PN500]|eukprot:XP_020426809.1 hypothetical protein PPL_11644 [Heterostelium album PN500]